MINDAPSSSGAPLAPTFWRGTQHKFSAILALVFAIISVALVAKWASDKDTAKAYLGGLNMKELLFSWHPVLMVSGMIFANIAALTSFTILPFDRDVNKYIHSAMHTACIICIIIGLYAVFESSNDHIGGAYYPNLNTLHSFIGLGAIMLYFQNYIFGFIAFTLRALSLENRQRYMPNHVILGTIALVAAGMATLTGIMELTTELHCGDYTVTEMDTNPAKTYERMALEGCKVANALGVFVMLAVIATLFAIMPQKQPKASSGTEGLL